MYDTKLNATLNHDLRMSRIGKTRTIRREPPKYLLPDGPACAAPSHTRRLVDEYTAIGLREAGCLIRLTRVEAVGILTVFVALMVAAALLGYANGVADTTLIYAQQEASQGR